MDEHRPVTGRITRIAWATACVLLVALLQSFFHQSVALPAKAIVLAFTLLAAWRPHHALLILAGAGPVAPLLLAQGQHQDGLIFYAEIIALAFLVGWTARQAITPRALAVRAWIRIPALLLLLAVLVSAVVNFAGTAAEQPGVPWTELLRLQIVDYATHPGTHWAIDGSALLAEGLLLLLAVADLTGSPDRRNALIRMVIVGAAAAAVFNVVRVGEVALRDEARSAARLWDVLLLQRINVHFPDRNAAGSYFAMVLVLSGAAVRSRALLVACVPLLAAGLWLSGSRVALAAAVLTAAAALVSGVWHTRSRRQQAATLGALAALILTAAAIWYWYPEGRNYAGGRALQIRYALATAGIEMAMDHPVFGVGPGRFYWLSEQYAGPALTALGYYEGPLRENAHNNLIQLLAELGFPGFIALLCILGASAIQAATSMPLAQARWLIAALAAYLLTCLGGHPLLWPESALPFWIVLGLAGAGEVVAKEGARTWTVRVAPAVIATVLLGSIWPRTVAAVSQADRAGAATGFSRWQRDEHGRRYRWAGRTATFYIPSAATAVDIPVMAGGTTAQPLIVRLRLDGRDANAMTVRAGEEWRTLRILMPQRAESPRYVRVDLAVEGAGIGDDVATDERGLIKVGAPDITWPQQR